MKNYFLIGIILFFIFLYSSCSFLNNDESSVNGPNYSIPILWKSEFLKYHPTQIISNENGIYAYNFTGNHFLTVRLNRLDPENGEIIWSTEYFENIDMYQPIISNNYIYAGIEHNEIICFDIENGSKLARVKIALDNENIDIFRVTSDYYLYDNYLYFGFGNYDIYDYTLARIDLNSIIKDGNNQEQIIEPELLWKSHYNSRIRSRPVVYNDIVYCSTIRLDSGIPIELAGVDINTKEEIFYDSFGNYSDFCLDAGSEKNPLYIKDNVLYYLSWSIAAYKLSNYQKLYHIRFYHNTPEEEDYSMYEYLDATFHNNKIYYTTSFSNYYGSSYHNIFCVDESNGKLVWSDIPKKSESLGSKPIIFDNKLFIQHMNGVRVYNADTGKLLGIDKTIDGDSSCFNQLIDNKMITVMYTKGYRDNLCQIVALDLSR